MTPLLLLVALLAARPLAAQTVEGEVDASRRLRSARRFALVDASATIEGAGDRAALSALLRRAVEQVGRGLHDRGYAVLSGPAVADVFRTLAPVAPSRDAQLARGVQHPGTLDLGGARPLDGRDVLRVRDKDVRKRRAEIAEKLGIDGTLALRVHLSAAADGAERVGLVVDLRGANGATRLLEADVAVTVPVGRGADAVDDLVAAVLEPVRGVATPR